MREENIIVHQPPAPGGAIEDQWKTYRADARQDDRQRQPNDVVIGEQQHRGEETDQGDAVIERHGAEEKPLVAFKLQPAARTLGIDFEQPVRPEKRPPAAIGTAVGQTAREDLSAGNFHRLGRSSAEEWVELRKKASRPPALRRRAGSG